MGFRVSASPEETFHGLFHGMEVVARLLGDAMRWQQSGPTSITVGDKTHGGTVTVTADPVRPNRATAASSTNVCRMKCDLRCCSGGGGVGQGDDSMSLVRWEGESPVCEHSLGHIVRASVFGGPLHPYCFPVMAPADVSIYFGAETVHLRPVDGRVLAYAEDCVEQLPNTGDTRSAARRRLLGEGLLGDAYKHVYIPCVPAADPVWRAEKEGDVNSLPEVLRQPLIKDATGSIVALRSGGRSAVLFDTSSNALLRLKGCGNYVAGSYGGEDLRFPFPGLPVRPMDKVDLLTLEPDVDAVEVRGCAFPHTAMRELLMSAAVDRALQPWNIPCGLRPLGYWEYRIPEEPLPEVRKACGLFETLGERRVASHLIPGLERLVPYFLDPVNGPGDTAEAWVARLFPANRRGPFVFRRYDAERQEMTESECAVVVTPHAISNAERFPGCPIDGNRRRSDVGGVLLRERVPSGRRENCDRVLQEEIEARAEDLEHLLPLAHHDLQSMGASAESVLSHLSFRIGAECAMVRKAMNDAGISWGNYIDHGLEPHNNSHPNNLVVLPPTGGAVPSALIAPIDLDMAYHRDAFFLNATGECDAEEFEDSLRRETRELRSNLAGDQSSTGLFRTMEPLSDVEDVFRWWMRDTLVAGYDTIMDDKPNPYPPTEATHRAEAILVRLALVASRDCVS